MVSTVQVPGGGHAEKPGAVRTDRLAEAVSPQGSRAEAVSLSVVLGHNSSRVGNEKRQRRVYARRRAR